MAEGSDAGYAGGSRAAIPRGLIKSPLDFAAGLLLVVVALVGICGSLGLRFGHLTGVGPGLLPRSVAVLVRVFGVGLVVHELPLRGHRLERWHLRGPILRAGRRAVFAMTIRGSTLTFGSLKMAIRRSAWSSPARSPCWSPRSPIGTRGRSRS